MGLVVAGLGGRLVMRLAAILQPDALGHFTENGNRIGEITLSGSIGLILAGLVLGLMAATVWVVVSPWVPGAGLPRAILAMPISVALGSLGLIRGDNRDFRVLQHDPLVVAVLIALVALIGLAIALLDDWLERRLPPATADRKSATALYAIVTMLGAVLVFPVVLLGYLAPALFQVGLALVAVGLCTVAWWVLRYRGVTQLPVNLTIAARGTLVAAIVFGFAALVREASRALGMA